MQRIPGVLRLYDPAPGHALPILVDSPHSGSDYPIDFHYICDKTVLERYEDRAVDQLLANFHELGATLLCAEAARSYIDLNRALSDMTYSQIEQWRGYKLNPKYALRGIGLIWETANGHDIYEEPIKQAEVETRINAFYHPYYKVLNDRAKKLKARFGKFWHLNVHSMPKDIDADIILGTLDGKSCSEEFASCLESAFSACGLKVRKNLHYKGANLTRLFGRPHDDSESVQIEINKDLYLRDDLLTIDYPKFVTFKRQMENVFKMVGNYTMQELQALKTPANDTLSAASRSSIEARMPSAASEVTP